MVARKLIHATLSLVAAAVVWALPYPGGAVVVAAATSAALLVELARRAHHGFGQRFLGLLRPLLREGETARLTGATTLALGYTVVATAFSGWPAVAGILITGLADPAAALAGTRFGRRRYPGGKSVEGSAAFLGVTLAILLLVPGLALIEAIGVAFLLTLIEAPRLRVDDNLYLPVLAAAAIAVTIGGTTVGGFS